MAPGENEFDIPALGCIEKTKISSSIPILLSYLPLKIPGRLCKGLVSVGKSSPGDSDMGHKQGELYNYPTIALKSLQAMFQDRQAEPQGLAD